MTRTLSALALLLCLSLPVGVRACPSCRDSVPESASNEEEDPVRLGMAYNRSIYLMLAVPYSLTALVGFLVWRQIRLKDAGQRPEA